MGEIEVVTESEGAARLLAAEVTAMELFAEVERRGLITARRRDRQVGDEIRDLAGSMFGVQKYSHKRSTMSATGTAPSGGPMRATAEHLAPYRQWRMSYRSDGRELAGFWLTPGGDGPHPAVVFNHGSIGLGPASLAGIEVLLALGCAVFAPIRRGHNEEPGPYWLDLVPAPWGSPEMGRQLVAVLREELVDVLAAVEWVAARPEVDAGRIAMAGSSFGGALTVLALSEPAPLRAGVSFAGPSMSWPDAPALQTELLAAAASGTAPLFLAQAFNDHSLQPTYAIGAEMARCGRPHETRVYQAIGDEPMTGHGIFATGVDLWRGDIGRFLARWVTG